ncbi:MAG: DUF4860 domain-containing protein [Lachnospiraceae bacterium]|nr:DUF4860 domain-containing protein [Lachnospiraceae bacterium]MDD3796272.1 DUF4860 domain-containing protein [Lachnospiraceae bacterium]
MRRQEHSMDTVFALTLFALFAVSSMLLILLGTRVYGRIAGKMKDVDAPVILSYLTEKLRRYDSEEQIRLLDGNRLLLQEEGENGTYVTWIYTEDGYLKESLLAEGKEPVENAGTVIGAVRDFAVSFSSDQLIQLSVTDGNGDTGERWYYMEGTP